MGLPLITGEKNGVEGLVVGINRNAYGAQAYCIYEQGGELKRATPVYNGFPGSLSDEDIIELVKYTIEADGSNSPGQYYCVQSTNIQITIDTLPAYLNSIYHAAFGEDYSG